ncbi:ABC transporter ATP-binding protein [Mammaliicoccus lentus]|uniref:ABC transporter ATP-binding protein n=1 Tax=Mammaliicoccus lentus TaxID=42858 RepID=UPI001071B453|nr:ABC transporter ATP-binding protein [Mammaliicoccus lentus]MBF0749571.1 ABC transporter ATP-binding protein [Mammaliicoccus lentus]TFU57440.1 ABC transporter ATP-binding protein [Mammaliicoccus lentus]
MQIENVKFQYSEHQNLFENLNIQFKKHAITTIVGPNGAGKSTLLQILSNNLKPTEGLVYLNQKLLSSFNKKELARHLATVHQKSTAPDDFTVREVVKCGRYSYQSLLKKDSRQEEVIDKVLQQLDLMHYQDTPIQALSGGELQRVYIAMSLAQESKYMLLDEPTTYLDLYYQYQVLDIVRSLKETYNMTIIMVLHDINQAIEYSDEIICINKQQLIQGPPEEIVTESLIESVYGIKAKVIKDPECGVFICKRKGKLAYENNH